MKYCMSCQIETERYADGKCKQCLKARHAAWREANPNYHSEYRKTNKNNIKVYKAAYRKANSEARNATNRNRRAKIRNSVGSHTASDVLELLILQRSKCACCKTSIKNGYHVDHVMPIAKGGSNDKLNLQLLCQPCNNHKHAKHPIDFMQERGFLL